MKIVFVYKGNGKNQKNSIIDAQITSIKDPAIDILKFPLQTSGIISYLTELIRLRKFVKKQKPDLIHAHYSYSGIISALTHRKTVCSLMGTDVNDDYFFTRLVTHFFYKFVWVKTIVKSRQKQRRFPKSVIIPNGVNFEIFKMISFEKAIAHSNLSKDVKNIIFVAEHIDRKVKNYSLAKKAFDYLPKDFILTSISGTTHQDLVNYYNAADVLLLTSVSEGSPNVIKEAMACNCPIVSTDVGDVKKVIYNTKGCYICDDNPADISEKIKAAINFSERTNGRENIKHLDANIIADKLCLMYKQLLKC
jgi:teichuronic acid biosynthesis glycosyltransferase TuaC